MCVTCSFRAKAALESLLRGPVGSSRWPTLCGASRTNEDSPTKRNVVLGTATSWLNQVGGLVNKQCGPRVVEKFLTARTRVEKERQCTMRYERSSHGDTPTRRYYYTNHGGGVCNSSSSSKILFDDTSSSDDHHRPSLVERWRRLPLLKITPFYLFFSLAYIFLNALI